ncbi:MAG TPA: hypothetical protein PLK24_09540 [Atribacter sp.]|uniref:hypothetical protein n=1 Tax=Atribacter sp. TaxID=2847780 RepID=UPI002B80ADDC|nr:hypothetical protein [Atribacter sp.]HQK84168.1 hypothetical protein [Atribacter sp.]
MTNQEVEDLFKKLNISKESLPSYSDPYSFADQIKRASLPKDETENISYSTGTGLLIRKE